MTVSQPRYDTRHRRVHLSVQVHPDTLAALLQLKKERGLSMGLLVDELVRTARQTQEQRT
jgi:hypothetical protein